MLTAKNIIDDPVLCLTLLHKKITSNWITFKLPGQSIQKKSSEWI